MRREEEMKELDVNEKKSGEKSSTNNTEKMF